MASPQQTELSYAWEKYMDCRLQGADLQVGTAADTLEAGAGVTQVTGTSQDGYDAYFECPGIQGSGPVSVF